MNLQKATSRELISLGCEFSTKLEAINYLVDKLDAAGKLSSRDEYYRAVLERESLSETGIDMGMAVPHGKSKAVREAAFAVATVRTPIKNWESIVPGSDHHFPVGHPGVGGEKHPSGAAVGADDPRFQPGLSGAAESL